MTEPVSTAVPSSGVPAKATAKDSVSADLADRQRELRVGYPADQRGVFRWIPGLYTLRHYDRAWLIPDISAGLVLTAVQVPVGMAYATAAGLPAIYGLYATIVPLCAYTLFGPSRVLVLGPDSSLAPMIASAVLPIAAGDPRQAVAAAGMLAVMAGLFGLIAGLLRLGFITDLLAKPIRCGYMNGIALTVLVSQLPKLFGFSVSADRLSMRIAGFVSGALAGKTNVVALAIGGCTLVIILALKRFVKVPGVLVPVVGATLVTGWFHLSTRYGVGVLGDLPGGLPAFALPTLGLHQIGSLASAAVAIAVVSFADTSVLSRAFSAKTRAYVEPNQEMIGMGVANVAAGVFQGFPISSSSSRTPVAYASGSKTQLSGLISAAVIALLLVFAPQLLRYLPNSALAGVVIAAAVGLFQFDELARLFRVQLWEFWLAIAAFLGVATLGAVPGILIGIGIALAEFIWDAWRPHFAILGRARGVEGYHDLTRYPEARQIPGVVLFRWDAPLFFANAEKFREVALESVASASTPVRWLVVAAEPVTGVDVSSVDMLAELHETLRGAGVTLVFAEMKDPVKDALKRFGLFEKLGEAAFCPTMGAAVKAYLRAHPDVEWDDWGTLPPHARP